MCKEAYVSFEVAKLLKEKGFLKGVDLRLIPNLAFYDNVGLQYNVSKWYDSLIQDKIDFFVAPTQQMAMAWLRKCWKNKEGCIDGFCIEPYAAAYRYGFTISRVPTGSHICNETNVYPNKVFESYEESVEAALKYTLENLI